MIVVVDSTQVNGQTRIVLSLFGFPKLSETFIVNKFLGLLERGWDVHVMCEESDPKEWARFPHLNNNREVRSRVHVAAPRRPHWRAVLLMPSVWLRCFFGNPLGMWRYLRGGWRRMGREIIRRLYMEAELILLRPNLLHYEFGARAYGRMHLRELLDCKTVVSFRGYDLDFAGVETSGYYMDVWSETDGVHCLGEELWIRAQRQGCPSDKLHALIPPAIDTNYFAPPPHDEAAQNQTRGVRVGTSERPLRVLSIGRLHWKKGYEYALQAVKIARERGLAIEYHIVSIGDYLDAVAFCREQLGVADCVSLLGAITREELYEQMQWADVFLHAAVSEGFCNAVMEAQAMRIPVVCADAGGLPENVQDGVTGWVVPRRDPLAIAKRLMHLASDSQMRERMGDAGRERVLNCFQLENQITAFEKLYRQTLNLPLIQAETYPSMQNISSKAV